MGRIDVYELSSEGGNSENDCILREFKSGKSEKDHSTIENLPIKNFKNREKFLVFLKIYLELMLTRQ